MIVETLSRAEDLAGLRGEWNQLLQASRANTVFLTWEWISTWWQVYGGDGELLLLVARDGAAGRLVGIAPLKRCYRKLLGLLECRAVEFIGWGGDVTPEHLDFIAHPSRETEVVDAFVRRLLARGDVDFIDLRPIRYDSLVLERMASLAGNGGGQRMSVDAAGCCPVAFLPATVDEFLSSRSRNYRKKIREYERRCARDLGAHIRVSTSASDVETNLRQLMDLHARRWGSASRAFRSAEYQEFHSLVARRFHDAGWTRLFALETTAGPAALLYCFAYSGRYYYYQAGWDPALAKYRPGLVLMHQVIQHAIGEQAAVFDFLSGEEPYKFRWATARVNNLNVRVWRGVAVSMAMAVHRAARQAVRHGRRVARGVRQPEDE